MHCITEAIHLIISNNNPIFKWTRFALDHKKGKDGIPLLYVPVPVLQIRPSYCMSFQQPNSTESNKRNC